MLLQVDAAHGDLRVLGIAAEIKHQCHFVYVHTLHVALIEHVGLVGFQLDGLSEEERVVVALLEQFHGHVIVIGVGDELGREVIAVGTVGGHVGVEEHLGLPLLRGGCGQADSVAVAVGLHGGVGYLRPSGSVIEGMGELAVFPQIAVAVGIEALEAFAAGGQDEVPRDVGGFVVIDEIKLRGSDVLDAEARTVILRVGREVGKERLGRQHQVERGAFHLEVIVGRLLLHIGRVVVAVAGIGAEGGPFVHIHCAPLAGIVGVAALRGEGQAVVVEPHGGLLVGLRTIPAGARSAQRSATEMPGERVGDAPLLALARLLRPSGQEIVVLVEVDYRVVNVERQCVGTCTDAVAVAYAVGNLIVTGHGENHRLTVDGGIGGLLAARKQPHGIARGIVEREGHGIGGLVNGGRGLGIHDGGHPALVGAGKLFGRTGGKSQCCQQCATGVFEYLVHHTYLD